jgi:WD40 repeat protein
VKSGASVHAWVSERCELFWAVSPDGKMVARQIGFSRKNDLKGVAIMISDVTTGAEIRRIPLDAIEGPSISSLYFLPGTVCAAVQKIVYRWDVRTGQALSPLDGHTNQVLAVVPSPDGSQIETVEWEGTARIWDAASGSLLHTYRYPTSWKIAYGTAAAWPAGGQPSVIIVRLEGPELIPLEE